ncbi:uncharacterized protein LOC128949871 isoform X2 [Melozone crissalis]|nr:uncharacterized protein LOC128949871 isoform X2 [Melozone crissalis]XP_054150715.1 uncharacterized protein LOC128949871 isoform X2 [Melozone crissalis]XP_054150716.1 uncharacterized protein LOC128949871 isoform X2 [Melozone crissalis]
MARAGGMHSPAPMPGAPLCPDPKMGAGKLGAPSWAPAPLGPCGARPRAAAGNNPRFPFGDPPLHPEPRWGRAPQGSRDGAGAGRGGCGRKNGKDRALPRREEQDPAKPFLGVFLQTVPVSSSLIFLSGATSSGATTKPSSVPNVPAVLPPRSRPAELRRCSFFPIITIIIINSNAGCNKKNQLFSPEEAPVVPPGLRPSPSVHDLPMEQLHFHGTGSLAKKTAGKNQDPRKKIKTTPAKAGEGSGSPRVKHPAGSPPENAKGITESPQSKAPTAREGSGALVGNGVGEGRGEGELGLARCAPEGPTCSRIRHQRDHAMVTATSLLSQMNTFYIFIYIIII